MRDRLRLDAAKLRALGVGDERIESDDELVAMVELLLDLGVDLDDMVGVDLSFLAVPRFIRPDATIDPSQVFRDDGTRDFRARAAIALGYNINEDARLLTPAEVETVQFFERMRQLLGDDETLALMRVMGSSMGRLARSVISAIRLHYENPGAELIDSPSALMEAYRDITDDVLPAFLDASSAVLRRHIAVAAASPSNWNVDGSHAATMERLAVGFVDMVGFTSFTERADLPEFIAALTAFESQANEVIITNGGTLVKLIGDEVMFVAPTPASAIEISRRLARLPLGDTGPGSVRIGLSAGEVVAVGGDFYGTVVNIAARAVRHAEPATIIATADVVNGAHASTRFEPIGARSLRGISDPVELFQLVQ